MQGRQQGHVATRFAKAAFQADLDALLRPRPRASVRRVKLVGIQAGLPFLADDVPLLMLPDHAAMQRLPSEWTKQL